MEGHYHRRSVRLQGYDYRQNGAYFVTICAFKRQCLFGKISADGMMYLSKIGEIVQEEWLHTAIIRPTIELDAFILMPNHLHAIVVIVDVGAHSCAPLPAVMAVKGLQRTPKSLGSLIAGFKAATTKRINVLRNTPGIAVWQRNYYEHIIRNERDLAAIRDYIQDNPAHWAADRENPLKTNG